MPELHQILGSLFSDIAQSVFTSDLYSRDISRYYEEDGLLRHFPVPRTEISELEVDLKFAISEIELNPAQTVSREANAATIFIDFCYDLSESFFKELHDVLLELKVQGKSISAKLLADAASEIQPIYLRRDLLIYFQRRHGTLIEEGTFQVDKAGEGIRDILEEHLNELLGKQLTDNEKKEVLDRVIKAVKLESGLKAQVEPLRFAWNRAGDFKMNVEITAEKLGELDSEHLSSVHVRTRVRNYKWSQIEHEGKDPWWRLNPE